MSVTKPSVDSVYDKFETSIRTNNPDRSNGLFHEAMRDADRLSGTDKQLLTKKLVENGLLPDVAIHGNLIKDQSDATVMKMYDKGKRDNPKTFAEHVAREMSTDKSHLDRAKEILKQKKLSDYDYREKSRAAAETANADRQFDSLLKKSGATDKGRDFLTKDDLKELKRNESKLTEGEKRALDYLEKNYDKLETRWTGKSEDGITRKSLRKYSKSELGAADEKVESAKRAQIEQEVLKNSKHTIGDEGKDGYWGIAKQRLSESGRQPTNPEIYKEMQRLQKLNPDKKVIHRGDTIRTQSDEDLKKEIDKRLRAA
ncbi:MAG TPA: hypothetical protein V6D17_10360 [Candidatus Obscuribacterales bacterium]